MGDGRRPLGTPEEISAYVGLSVHTLYDQRRRGVDVGSLAVRIGRHLRWYWEDVDEFLAGQRVGSR
jgi:predicted DNA-binding transcriptional regulator AlpA